MKNNNTTQNGNRERSKSKILILLLLLLVGASLITVSVVAYFSDILSRQTTLTAGTLDITGSYEFYVNGAETPSAAVSNLNPGDAVVVKATVTNEGSKSAWVRECIDFTSSDSAILSFMEVYTGEFTQAQLKAGGAGLSASRITLDDNIAASANRVLDGTGASAEEEEHEDYECIGSNTYSVAITIYFSHTATNAAQGKNLVLTVKTQALQYRNNNASEPDEEAWATAEQL